VQDFSGTWTVFLGSRGPLSIHDGPEKRTCPFHLLHPDAQGAGQAGCLVRDDEDEEHTENKVLNSDEIMRATVDRIGYKLNVLNEDCVK